MLANIQSNSQQNNWQLPPAGSYYRLDTTPMLHKQASKESEVRSYPRRLPIAIKQGYGALVMDEQNQVFLDCLAGAGALPLGHNNLEVNRAIIEAMQELTPSQTLDLTTPAKDRFMQELLDTLPKPFSENAKLQFCGPSGTDAVEAAIKLAKTITDRSTILTFQGGYHGMTNGSLSLTGNLSAKNAIQGLMADVHFMPYPYPFRSQFGDRNSDNTKQALHYLHSQLADPEGGIKKPAAIIVEAIQGEGGVIPAPIEWLQGLRKLCTEFGIILIVDEVQTGFGRTGKLFGFEHAGITPDIIIMSKAIGGGLPMAVIAFDQTMDAWSPGGHSGTFRGNQLAMVSGKTALQIIKRDRLDQHAKNLGEYLLNALSKIDHPQIGQVRGKGLMIGIELVSINNQADSLGNPLADGLFAKKVQYESLRRGLICELGGRHGSVLRLLPPLIINQEQADFIIRVIDAALDASSIEDSQVVNG